MNKNDYPDRSKNRRGDLCKSQGSKDKVPAFSQAQSTWGIQSSKDLRFKASANQSKSKTQNRGNSKSLGRIEVTVFNIPFPYIYHFPKKIKIGGVVSLASHH